MFHSLVPIFSFFLSPSSPSIFQCIFSIQPRFHYLLFVSFEMFRVLWNNKFGKLAIILAGCCVVYFWNSPFIAFSARTVFGTIAFPLQNVTAFVGYHVGQLASFFSSIGTLKRENEQLLEENTNLKAENALLADQSRENELLRQEIQLAPRDRFSLIAAEVIGRDSASSGGAVLINKGTSSGVGKGMAVIAGAGTLIGRVAEVTPLSSRVLLISDSGSAINAVAGAHEARGVVRGEYGLGLVLDLVLQSDTLASGDEVITSGLGGDIPRGLLIGSVTSIESSADRLFQRATLASPLHIDQIRFVSVVINAKS